MDPVFIAKTSYSTTSPFFKKILLLLASILTTLYCIKCASDQSANTFKSTLISLSAYNFATAPGSIPE